MTNDIPTLPPVTPPSPETVSPPPPEAAAPVPAPAPSPTEEAALAATGEGVPAAAAETPPPSEPSAAVAPEPPAEEAPAPAEPKAPEPPPSNKHWYVVKVQSGREESIKEAVERRVKIEGLEEFYGQIVIPVEKVVEMRNSKRVTRERKLYPGYLMAEVEYNDRVLYLFRETSGVGDFVGAGVNRAPTPMTPREVERMMRKTPGGPEQEAKEVHGKPPVDRGDRVKVKDGTFAGMEGEVKEVIEAKSQVRVELVIFGRPVPVDLEYWQVEPV
ncbi:MAG TPA: transcription termination/antitermination protein NusG [Gemmataceae bacterium]|nr:transcription termination/antitermination protein NusG [Gemmataceae bacterium]